MADTPKLTPEQATAYLYQRVHVPVFLQKLAQYEIVPANEEEAVKLLATGQRLYEAEQAGQFKQAAAPSPIVEACNAVIGAVSGQPRSYPDHEIKQAAAQLLNEPETAAAVAALAAA